MRQESGQDGEWIAVGDSRKLRQTSTSRCMTRRLVAISASLMVSCCPSRPVHGELHALSQGGIAATIDHAQANPFSNLRLKGGGFDSALQWGESMKCRVKTTVSEQYADLKAGLKRKRLELCPWEEFAIECEEAFTYHQLWVNPCQGWNSMQRVIDSAAKKAEGAAFVPTHFWPATLVALAQAKLKEYGRSTATAAPPFGSNQGSSWFGKAWGGEDAHAAPTHDVQWVNDKLVAAALQQQQDDASWEAVSSEGGVTVWRKYLPREMRIAGKPIGVSSKFACVKAKAVIDAPLDKVYALFLDNSRVQEYNEYCKNVEDLEWLDPATKVTHSFTGRPWSRDFVTRVHYRALGTDARIVVSRAEEHPKAEATGGYTRMEMALGANIMRRVPGDASKTEFTLITHVNPGGFASTQFGAAVTNRLSTESPRQFIAKLTAAASADRRAGGRRAEGQLGLAGRVRKHARESLIGGAALGAMTLLSRKGGGGGRGGGDAGGEMFAPEFTASCAGAGAG